ncbi:hypothetical protein KFU94_69090 [Chloroflexi bacterium TSY]|nr:hypothetical protein [Chloroflexi bacterium TSY]
MSDYRIDMDEAGNDAQRFEALYQTANQTGTTAAFIESIEEKYQATPENLLYAAWHFRLAAQNSEFAGIGEPSKSQRYWRFAILLSLLSGVLFWFLSDFEQLTVLDEIPLLALAWAPISACFVMVYLQISTKQQRRRGILLSVCMIGLTYYVIEIIQIMSVWQHQEDYLLMMIFHLPLLSWSGVGYFILWKDAEPDNLFAFIIKSLEALLTGGLFVAAGGLFTGLSIAMFSILDIDFSTPVLRIFFAGGAGLIPVLAVATIYDLSKRPMMQSFRNGLSMLISTLIRLLLPLILLVMAIYTLLIPFNIMGPFENRDVLITYNGMLFAVVALLITAIPVHQVESTLFPKKVSDDVSQSSNGKKSLREDVRYRSLLRYAIIAIASLTILISLHALAAILYRTWNGGLTLNRLNFTFW